MQKQFKMVQRLAVVATALTLLGCETTTTHDQRSEGRILDDKQITENVEKELQREPVYKFDSVKVSTFGGVVQLSGFVNTDEQKNRAAEIAQRVSGVHEVSNGITLKPEPMTPTGSTNSGQSRIYSE
jgi:osmotically-inducible protein OsmY